MIPQTKVKVLHRVYIGLTCLILFFGITALIQPLFDSNHRMFILTGELKMRINTAIIVILGGLSMLLLCYKFIWLVRLLISCLFILTSLILTEHFLQVDLGIDNWFSTSHALALSAELVGRTSFLAALTGFLLSIGIMLFSFKRYTVAQLLAFITFTLMYASLLGYLFTFAGIFQKGLYVSIRFNVALALLLWSAATLLYKPSHGWMALVYQKLSNSKLFNYILAYFLCTIPVLVAAYLFILEQAEISKASGILTLLVVIAIISIPGVYQLLIRLKKLEQYLKRSNEQLNVALRVSGMGVWNLDIRSGIITRSEMMAELFGHHYSETISLEQLLTQVYVEDQEQVWQVFKAPYQDGLPEAAFRIVMPDKRMRWIQICGETKYDENGLALRILGTMKDITSRKEMERHKDEFVSTVSHELKTPITSIKAQTQLLERKFSKSEDQATAMMLQRINLQIGRLTTIISDLLQAGQVEEQKLTLRKEEYFFKMMVEETVAEVQRTTKTHQLMVEHHPEIACIGDRDRTCQVLSNLLTNAIKYSPSADKVVVHFTEQENQVYCSVQDFGFGISAEKQNHIFERFYRVNGERNRIISGFGLGLYICAQIIRRLNGKIGLNSVPGEGSIFYFTVPKIV